ncbi:isochorismatase family protein [Peribacillus saganii]|uniref:Isochorismatase family protein n=1 Tax=Peribacillus saganii TaxID=2303992 RepID=A0A372LQN2_9BACI|nr:isochorismatase family protein [Peribacillus saganii]RFU70511.1 isochorismatase family protein [Peribacillus saganii]
MLYDKLLNISEAAKLLGVSAATLRRLESKGVVEGYGLKVIYTPGGQRRYILEEVQQLYTNQGFSGQLGFGKRPAILIRDLTLAFLDPLSKLAILQEKQVKATKELAIAAAQNDIPVIFSQSIYDPAIHASRLWCQKFPSLRILEEGSQFQKMHPELEEIPYSLINKTPFITDFHNSSVVDFLKQNEIDTVILAGATTSGSIRATAVDALQNGYHVIIPSEAVGDRNKAIQTSTLLDLNARYADVLSLEKVINIIKLQP